MSGLGDIFEELYSQKKYEAMLELSSKYFDNPVGQYYHCLALVRLEDFTQAKIRALKFIKDLDEGEHQLKSKYYRLIGHCFLEIGDQDGGMRYYKKSLELSNDYEDNRSIAASLFSVGSVYEDSGDFEQAMNYYKRVWIIDQEHSSELNQAITLKAIGLLLGKLGKKKAALDNLEKSLLMVKRSGKKDLIKSIENSIKDVGLD